MSSESRADYFRERRKKYKLFTVEIERQKLERFEEKLVEEHKTKAEWLNSKIDEELST